MKKIKIMRIIARLNIGGPAIHTILLSEGLDKTRFESILVTGVVDKHEGDMAYLAQEKGITPIIIPALGRSLNIANDISTFIKIFSLIRKEKPDIVHTHTAKAGTLGRLAAMLYNIFRIREKCLLIHTFHGHVLHSYFGKSKSTLFVWIERFLARFTDTIIAVSESVKKDLLSLAIGNKNKIITIPLGLELEPYLGINRLAKDSNDGATSIGIIGRLVPVKNHKMFLRVAKGLKEAVAPEKMRFLVVGDGPLRSELEQYAQELGISEDVTFAGWVKNLQDVYSQLDIAALTSLNEGTPVALIEAQAAACPCVATDVGGMQDVIENEKSGFLVPSGDKKSFLNALLELIKSPQRARSMGDYGRNAVKNKFSKDRLIKDIEMLYESQLEKRKGRS